jgi:hypothetical protein
MKTCFIYLKKVKPVHLYDVGEDERYILPGNEPGFDDIPEYELPEIPTGGPMAYLKEEEQPRMETDENIVEILDDAEAASTMLGLKDKMLTVQDIPGDPTVKTSENLSVETRQSVDTTMLSSLSGDFLRGLSQKSDTGNLFGVFDNTTKSLFGSHDTPTKLVSGRSDASLMITPVKKSLKPKRRIDASDSITSSRVSSGTRAATKRMRESQAEVREEVLKPKQMESSRSKEEAER